MGKGLSEMQRDILLWLLSNYEKAERNGSPYTCWGVDWRPSRVFGFGYDRTKAAAISRSIVRLEQRGLLLRQNDRSGVPDERIEEYYANGGAMRFHGSVRVAAEQPAPLRCTTLVLTDAGRLVAIAIKE